MQYRGDIGKFRKALHESGFTEQATNIIFNDNSKDNMRRRLKLWFSTAVFNAPQTQQRKLEHKLKQAFGDRWITAYFIKQETWWRSGKSLCIKLKV